MFSLIIGNGSLDITFLSNRNVLCVLLIRIYIYKQMFKGPLIFEIIQQSRSCIANHDMIHNLIVLFFLQLMTEILLACNRVRIYNNVVTV